VRLLPSVASPPLLGLIAKHAPHAETLPPITSELRLQTLAREADVVVDLDPSDVFGRRALNAAAAGAAVVTVPGGAAEAVLGDMSQAGRGERASAVAAACAPEVIWTFVLGISARSA
jgi:hypothetical protein